jgi:spore maturation protein CgeB
MNIVVFGLTVSSSWGNGHATQWRGLGRALGEQGVRVTFFEKNQPYYANARDGVKFPGIELVLYESWHELEPRARAAVAAADAAIVTSFCPDAREAADLVRAASRFAVFYDLDTPVTLASLDGQPAEYLPRGGMIGFDLVLSFTGGPALDALARRLGAQPVRALYGCVDPEVYAPEPSARRQDFALSYLGTYAPDRQWMLASLFVEAARRLPGRSFLMGGAQYPQDFPWTTNTFFMRHVDPGRHREFYGAAPLTLNVTRASMARMGFCPSGRIFEAAACETTVISDVWDGIDTFFTPGEEILLARSVEDVVGAIELGPDALHRIGARARARVLEEHSTHHRARELLALLDEARGRPSASLARPAGAP